MRYRVTHQTTYSYEEIVSICHNEVRLEPRSTPRQRRPVTALVIEPTPAVVSTELDYFGNPTTFFTVQEPHSRMVLTARSDLELASAPPLAQEPALAWDELRAALRVDLSPVSLAAYEMCFASPLVPCAPELAAYAAPSFAPGRPIFSAARELTARIHEDFEYKTGATSVTTPVAEVLERRRGVCQDFAHLALACLRSLGLPARYVSGYLHTRPAPGRARLVGADASHAWISVYCGADGWIDFDPTNDLVADDQHVTLAWGRDYADVAPIKGVILGGGEHTVEVAVDVEPLG
jgi:transglutaminase-like putative cysteine protease